MKTKPIDEFEVGDYFKYDDQIHRVDGISFHGVICTNLETHMKNYFNGNIRVKEASHAEAAIFE